MTVFTRSTLAVAVLLASGFAASAEERGEHFMKNWDANADGIVTLEEAQTRRADMFASFDADTDGFLTEPELKLMDEMRDNEQASMNGGQGMGQGMGGQGKRHGQGMGQGMGHGQGMGGQGKRHGQGMGNGQGMGGGHGQGGHAGLDADNDGKVSKVEFTGDVAAWLGKFDRDGNGAVTAKDF